MDKSIKCRGGIYSKTGVIEFRESFVAKKRGGELGIQGERRGGGLVRVSVGSLNL